MNDPRFSALLAAAEARHRATADRALARYRASAVEALGASIADPDLDATERLACARALLTASQPASRAVEERAERALHVRLARIDAGLAKAVAAALASEQRASIESMSDEELLAAVDGAR